MAEVQIDVAPDADTAGRRAAGYIAGVLRAALAARGGATLALSGGSSPAPLYAALAREALDWPRVHVFQVDERLVPREDPARNLTAIARCLVTGGPLPAENLHAMPVEAEDGCARQMRTLEACAGRPPVLDVVQLGLGADGHTASLFPGDPALGIRDRDLALTAAHAGHRRMTLTLPAIDRARAVVWFAPGAAKAAMIAALAAGDPALPCGRVARDRARVFIDTAAAAALPAR